VIACVRIPENSYSEEVPALCGNKIVILESVQDPGNVGTVIRTAAAFNFNGVILSQQCADPFAPKAVQATAGALLGPWIRRVTSLHTMIDALKKQHFYIYGADVNGEKSVCFADDRKTAIAFGNEGAGLSLPFKKEIDELFAIPMDTTKVESLNVAVAAAITLFTVSIKGRW
jgi:TrmH family RNA methyltransferase